MTIKRLYWTSVSKGNSSGFESAFRESLVHYSVLILRDVDLGDTLELFKMYLNLLMKGIFLACSLLEAKS
jgi:hypothetical protein